MLKDSGDGPAHPTKFSQPDLEEALAHSEDDDNERQLKANFVQQLTGYYDLHEMDFGSDFEI